MPQFIAWTAAVASCRDDDILIRKRLLTRVVLWLTRTSQLLYQIRNMAAIDAHRCVKAPASRRQRAAWGGFTYRPKVLRCPSDLVGKRRPLLVGRARNKASRFRFFYPNSRCKGAGIAATMIMRMAIMTKLHYCLRATLLLFALLLPASATAYDIEVDGIFYSITSDTTVKVTYETENYNSYSGNVVIPETVTNNGASYTVTEIGDKAFYSCTNLITVSMPNTITSIGSRNNTGSTFMGCTALTSIVIPDNVSIITGSAFAGCTGLRHVTIGKSITKLRVSRQGRYFYAFQGCDSITTLTWNAVHCSDMGNMGTTNIEQLTIGPEVQSLPDNFVKESKICEVNIPTSVISIGNCAFQQCHYLERMNIPNSVTTIGSSAFAECYGLTNVEIPNSVITIGSSAFASCGNIATLSIGNSVTTIGESAFLNCELLENVDIPNTVTTIGSSAFSGCFSLKSIDIPNSVITIGSSAFSGCSNMQNLTIGNSVTSILEGAFMDCNKICEVNIPNSVTQIGRGAFQGCESLERVNITSIEAWCNISFVNPSSSSLYGVRVETSNPLYYAHHLYLNGQEIADLVIPNSASAINGYAFYGCSGLSSVTIPNTVRTIGECAFYGCSGINSLTIPNSVTSIAYWAFKDCTGLTDAIIGNSLTGIGGNAFSGCSELTSIIVADDNSIYDSRENSNAIIETASNKLIAGCQTTVIPSSVTSIASDAFEGRGRLTSIFIPKTVTSIGVETSVDYSYNQETHSTDTVYRYYYYNPFVGCNALTSIIVEESNPVYDSRDNCNAIIETATNKLFVGCKNTIIPNTVTAIGGGAFNGCTELTEINIPNSVIAIGDRDDSMGAFGGCTGLTKVTLGNSVKTIGDVAFMSCTGLTNIDLPSSLTTIGWAAFAGCTGLTSITIPNSVHFEFSNGYNDYQQFYMCTGLTSVTIGSGITDMGITFLDCPNITSVTCLATMPPTCHRFQQYVNGERIIVVDFDSEVLDQATLYVPAASLEAYQTAFVWREFQHIEPIPVMTGDVDGDGKVSIADVTGLINMLLKGATSAADYPAADVDGDGKITIADITGLINMLLRS